MAVEIALAIQAVNAISSLVSSSAEAVKKIRSGWRANNDEARRALEEKLAEVGTSLSHVGELARAAEAYSRSHEEVAELLQASRRVVDFLQENRQELSRKSDKAAHEAAWRVGDALFDVVEQNQSVPRSVLLDRAEWYDREDKDKIELRLNDFNGAYRDASKSIKLRFIKELESELERMISPLEDVEFLLRTTIYDKILRSLGRIA